LSFFEELKRRNVFRVAVAYIVATWVLLQVADLFMNYVDAPDWVMHVLMFFTAAGFIAAVIIAWAYELTPEGIKREKDVDRDTSIVTHTGRKLDRIIIAFLAVAVVLLLTDRYFLMGSGSITEPGGPPGSVIEPDPITTSPAKSIAVLPFADLSQTQDQEWFADGLAEEILNALAKTPDLQVSSRTSTFRYKGSDLDIPEIAAELGVAHVLEGSVRSSGNRIRVTAQLIRAGDGFHVWSENYDRTEDDIISIQEDLAIRIAEALETTMDPEALAQMTTVGTRSVEAYKAYLRGISLNSETVSDGNALRLLDALAMYQEAVGIDPRFAAAHRSIANFWQTQMRPAYTFGGITNTSYQDKLAHFTEAIELAIEHAPTPADRLGYQAEVASTQFRADAVKLYREYLEARPNDPLALIGYLGNAEAFSVDADRSNALSMLKERALESPDLASVYLSNAYQEHGPSEVADFGLSLLRQRPDHRGFLYQTHRALMWAGRAEEGAELKARLDRVHGVDALVSARQACIEGRRDDAEATLSRLSDDLNSSDDSQRWLILKMLGRDAEASLIWQPYAAEGALFSLATLLSYTIFDPSPYPILVEALERQGVRRPPPAELPYKCPPPEQTSIAVLPFVNMSADAENEFFSDGISEEILNVLASIPELKVAARTSAFAYKGTNTNISRIAQELGVNHVLEGSVRKAGNQVRVTAQLIQASDGFHLWSDNYDRELTNIFAIQDEIAGSIAEALKVTLELQASGSGNLTGTTSIKAYEHYLHGMQLWHQRTAESLPRSIDEFEAAILLDPGFAKAHAGLALAWSVISGYVNLDDEETYSNAIKAANRALALDPRNAEALASKSLVSRFRNNYAEAEKAIREAIRINPSFATAHQWYASLLGEMGDPIASMASYRKARSLDPRSRIIGYNLAYHLSALGEPVEARQAIVETMEFAPDFPDVLGLMMQIQILDGNCDAAMEYAGKLATVLNKQDPDFNLIRNLCQSQDPALRADAFETIIDWPDINFADPAHPTLLYHVDVMNLMIHFRHFDQLFELLAKDEDDIAENVSWFRNFRTPNGIQLQCDPRTVALESKYDVSPAVDPVACD
jgi:TolB-like protein/Flp pilus assembly protein TadD